MTDVHTSEIRRANMQAIRPHNTKPEITIRKILKSLGYGYRLHVKDLPGKPDIVLSKHHLVILVHGCFWHGHNCPVGHLPKSKKEYWVPKIIANMARDKKQIQSLTALGWRILIVRECALKGKQRINGTELRTYIQEAVTGTLPLNLIQAPTM